MVALVVAVMAWVAVAGSWLLARSPDCPPARLAAAKGLAYAGGLLAYTVVVTGLVR